MKPKQQNTETITNKVQYEEKQISDPSRFQTMGQYQSADPSCDPAGHAESDQITRKKRNIL
jgi:hypothetical protein